MSIRPQRHGYKRGGRGTREREAMTGISKRKPSIVHRTVALHGRPLLQRDKWSISLLCGVFSVEMTFSRKSWRPYIRKAFWMG
jgi:hypothetical protein